MLGFFFISKLLPSSPSHLSQRVSEFMMRQELRSIRYDNGKLSYFFQCIPWKCNKIPKNIFYCCFCLPSVSIEMHLVSQCASLSNCSQTPKSSDSSLSYGSYNTIILEVVCNSDDMLILDKIQSLSRKRQKVNDDENFGMPKVLWKTCMIQKHPLRLEHFFFF